MDTLELARESYKSRTWADAYRLLSLADQTTPLGVEDLERLAISAYLTGRDDDFLSILGRAHDTYLKIGDPVSGARCAFWMGLSLLLRGKMARASGWLARARRLLGDRDCVEQGYLLLPIAEQNLAEGNCNLSYTAASDAVVIGNRFGDTDLIACACHVQGRVLIQQGQVKSGLALLDEAMVLVTGGNLSPIVTGLIYCSVIEACQQVYALSRASEWTSALSRWCEQQPELVAFTATCLVRRAEIMQLRGDWAEAIEEAEKACLRFSKELDRKPPAAAFYQQAEVYRLRGEYEAAEEAYEKASRGGCEPQPGFALLRMAQGKVDIAGASIRRVESMTAGKLDRARLLPAYVEIMLALDEIREARTACGELDAIAEAFNTDVLGAMACQTRGAVELAEGDAQAALGSLQKAEQIWQEIQVPYREARVRELIGLACDTLGDVDGARLELDAARAIFERLGAVPDLKRVESLSPATLGPVHGLTPRELEVLRLVATGKTNKAIAETLFLSEKTIDRHLSNIFTKLDVHSRTAATAYAYEHKLL